MFSVGVAGSTISIRAEIKVEQFCQGEWDKQEYLDPDDPMVVLASIDPVGGNIYATRKKVDLYFTS